MNIPVYQPNLDGNEKQYVNDCLDTSWISSKGGYIAKFEKAFKDFTHISQPSSCCNGTVALHLALQSLGIGQGDEVIVPTFTYVASVNAIKLVGATPVFVDSDPMSWQISVDDVLSKINSKTKAILAVHLYGGACDMNALVDIVKARNLFLVEDCAEALGTTIGGTHMGRFGNVSTFSFFGNKTITTGEGGMVATQDEQLSAYINKLKNQGMSENKRYWHDVLGFNYRMTNIAAAIGVAQFERINKILDLKSKIKDYYRDHLATDKFEFPIDKADVVNSNWLVSFLVPENSCRDTLIKYLDEKGVETRPVFYCANQFPFYNIDGSFPVAEKLAKRGISVPSYPDLEEEQLKHICHLLNAWNN